MRLRAAGGNLLLAVVSIGITLAFLEVAARVAILSRQGGKENREALHYIDRDEYLGWRKIPGSRVTFERREYTVEVVINAMGMRDPERAPGSRAWRVLALGDSFVEGYSVPLADTVTQRLERALDRRSCPVEVLNAGTAAWSTDQEYLYYVREAGAHGARVVLLFLYFNDLLANTQSNYWGAPKPLLEARDGAMALTNHPVARPRRRDAPPPSAPGPPEIQGSAAWQWMRERLMHGAPRLFNALARLGLWDPIGGEEIPVQQRVFKRRRQPRIEAAWEQTEDILRALEQEVATRGARLGLVYVPSRMEVSDRDWELTRLRYDLNDAWDRTLVAERVGEMASALGMPLLDLTPALRRADQEMLGAPYYVHDGHWNARGHAVAAEAIREFLEAQGWLPDCPRVSATPGSP